MYASVCLRERGRDRDRETECVCRLALTHFIWVLCFLECYHISLLNFAYLSVQASMLR